MSHVASQFADWAWPQFWQTTVVAAVALLIARGLRNRQPHLAYVALLLVFVKCLTPPVWSSPLGVFSWTVVRDAPFQQTAMETASPPTATFAPPVTVDFGPSNSSFLPAEDPNVTVTETAATPITNGAVSASDLLFCVWAAGAVACAAFVGFATSRHWRAIRASSYTATGPLADWHSELVRKFKIKRPVRLWVSSRQHGPSCFGVVFPVIVLPEKTVHGLSRESIEPVLAHELIHIRRGDTLVGMVQVLAGAVWWFHPLIWLAGRELTQARERCCDVEVIGTTGCDPAAYAQSMLNVLKFRHNRPALFTGGIHAADITQERLESIMNRQGKLYRRTPWFCWFGLLAGTVLIVPGAPYVAFAPAQAEPVGGQSDIPQRLDPRQRDDAEVDNKVNSADEATIARDFFAVSVATDLQKKLLGHPDVVAYVNVDATSIIDAEMMTVDAESDVLPAIRVAMRKLSEGRTGGKLRVAIDYGTLRTFPRLQSLVQDLFRGIALNSGFPQVDVYGSHFNDDGYQRKGFDWDANEGDLDERPRTVDNVHIYPVKTALGRYLAGDVDCYIDIDGPVPLDARSIFSPRDVPTIERIINDLKLEKKRAARVNVQMEVPQTPYEPVELPQAKKYSYFHRDAVVLLKKAGFDEVRIDVRFGSGIVSSRYDSAARFDQPGADEGRGPAEGRFEPRQNDASDPRDNVETGANEQSDVATSALGEESVDALFSDDFFAVSVETDLQRKLLRDDHAVAYANVKARAIIDRRTGMIDPQSGVVASMRRTMWKLAEGPKAGTLVFVVDHTVGTFSRDTVNSDADFLRRISQDAGFNNVSARGHLDRSDRKWNAANPAEDGDESGVDLGNVAVYPVTTKLSRFLSPEVDCHIFVKGSVPFNAGSFFSADDVPKIEQTIQGFSLEKKRAVCVHVKIEEPAEPISRSIVGREQRGSPSHREAVQLLKKMGFDEVQVFTLRKNGGGGRLRY